MNITATDTNSITTSSPRTNKRANILKIIGKNRVNLYLDILLAAAFVAELELRFTGLRNHELLGLAMAAAFIIHIILHGQWVVSITKTFFKKLLHESRLNYVLNLALFIDMLVIIVTGVVISRTLGLDLGIDTRSFPWERIHILASDLSLVIVGLHVAMHWKWIATHAKKYLLSFKLPKFAPRPADTPAANPQ